VITPILVGLQDVVSSQNVSTSVLFSQSW